MELYELVVLLHPDLEIDIDKPLKKLEKIISDQDGKIAKMDNWGKRKLAYPIQKGDYAIYIYYEVELDKQKVSKLDGILNITDEVIRYLLVKVDEKGRKALEDAKVRAKARGIVDEDEE